MINVMNAVYKYTHSNNREAHSVPVFVAAFVYIFSFPSIRSFRADLNPMGWLVLVWFDCLLFSHTVLCSTVHNILQTTHKRFTCLCLSFSLPFSFFVFSRCVAYIEDERSLSLCDGNLYSNRFNAHFSIKLLSKFMNWGKYCVKSSVCSEFK